MTDRVGFASSLADFGVKVEGARLFPERMSQLQEKQRVLSYVFRAASWKF